MYSISLCFVYVTIFVMVTSGESYSSSSNDETYCHGTGWVAYRDEKCFKLFKKWTTRDEAQDVCTQEELQSDGSMPQLATIKSADEQAYLTELVYVTSAVTINVWIGAKRSNGSKFIWDDGSEVGEFVNWTEGSPTDKIQQSCVVMKSEYMKTNSQNTAGQWRDVPCDSPNYVLCEKLQRWSFTKLQKALLEARKESKDSNELLSRQLSESKIRLDVAEAKIEETKDKLVPIGFLYTQLPNEKSPTEIWPWMTWQDVSPAYANIFFRVEGSSSAAFGQVQGENAPRITGVRHEIGCEPYRDQISTVVGGKSLPIQTGLWDWIHPKQCFAFTFSGGEVRPRNMAVRVWKRLS